MAVSKLGRIEERGESNESEESKFELKSLVRAGESAIRNSFRKIQDSAHKIEENLVVKTNTILKKLTKTNILDADNPEAIVGAIFLTGVATALVGMAAGAFLGPAIEHLIKSGFFSSPAAIAGEVAVAGGAVAGLAYKITKNFKSRSRDYIVGVISDAIEDGLSYTLYGALYGTLFGEGVALGINPIAASGLTGAAVGAVFGGVLTFLSVFMLDLVLD